MMKQLRTLALVVLLVSISTMASAKTDVTIFWAESEGR